MSKRACFLFLVLVLGGMAGCGGGDSHPAEAKTEAPPAPPEGVPSPDEARNCIHNFFAQEVDLKHVEVVEISAPVEAPKEVSGTYRGPVWGFSVTMKCDDILPSGQKITNKNWLVLVGRTGDGTPTVKSYYNDLDRLNETPMNKDWLAKAGFGEPSSD